MERGKRTRRKSTIMDLMPIHAVISRARHLTQDRATRQLSRIDCPILPVRMSSPWPGDVASLCTANARPPSPETAQPTPMGKPPRHPELTDTAWASQMSSSSLSPPPAQNALKPNNAHT